MEERIPKINLKRLFPVLIRQVMEALAAVGHTSLPSPRSHGLPPRCSPRQDIYPLIKRAIAITMTTLLFPPPIYPKFSATN